MNSTEVQNPRRKLDDKVFMLIICVRFCSCLCKVCSCVSEALLLALRTLSLTNNSSSDSKGFSTFHCVLRLPQQQYTLHCMHYGITLWAYLSEPLIRVTNVYVRRKNHKNVRSCHLITHYRYVRFTERYTETLHVKKMADL